ncbi:DUF2975 domain-containing protein [Micromonospora sp. NPDC047548]|uniref:DUF2975 domain-containing protein n=1 Tax=Micromonospora sp. NPDC047548 TaxID=3155624 RepID=UPI003405B8A1
MKARESLRRADWLRELHGLLLVAVVVSGVVGVVGMIATLTGQPVDIEAPSGGVLRPDSLVNARAGAVIDADASIYLRVEQPSGVQIGLATVAALPTYILATTMLVMLWRLVGEARRTDPFTAATARRLRTLGWLLIVGGPVAWLVEFLARFALSGTVATGGHQATLNLGVPAVWFLAGFGILAISEVVRRGQALRAELDEVV